MSLVLYDSRISRFKDPFGAVPTGTEVSFTVYLPKLHLTGPPQLKLFNMDEWDDPIDVPMNLVEVDAVASMYRCVITPKRPALYAYYFDVYTSQGTLQIKRIGNGTGSFDRNGHIWQLTVYDSDMRAPEFLREGVIYQIFPDRFHSSGIPKDNVPGDRILRQDWDGMPYWRPNQLGEVTNSDYFLGDLKGIENKLDYLQSLGVTTIYLNPIFEAHSNHRYNTADYRKVDPLLGTEQDFADLCYRAGEKGISVVLDGVFNHTGSDSVYFNRNRRYGDGGAFNDRNSPYYKWYSFSNYPYKYDSWWGFETLPNVNEADPEYLEFICGKNGVLTHWLELGAKGFRLDVADELPDVFLDSLRESIKDYDPDACIIGEVWEDASNKVAYGERRRYLLGKQLDSVMNYPFQVALLDYIRYGNSEGLYNAIMMVLENYPKPAIQCLMNFLSTHDTIRALTALACEPAGGHDRGWQESRHHPNNGEYETGIRLLSLASILQFGLPGIPCVYYGDEAGLYGYKDPFNRTCYPWGRENHDLIALVSALGQVRKEYPIFADAEFCPIVFTPEVCGFTRRLGDTNLLFAVNRSYSEQRLFLPKRFIAAKQLVLFGSWENDTLGPISGIVLLAPKQD